MYRVTIKDQTTFIYDVDAPDEATANAFAFRAHGANQTWGERAHVISCVVTDAVPAPAPVTVDVAVDVNNTPNPAIFIGNG